jgi:hypothetical protein
VDVVFEIAALVLVGSIILVLSAAAGVLWELRVKWRRRNRAIARTVQSIVGQDNLPDTSAPWSLEGDAVSPGQHPVWRPLFDPSMSHQDRWRLSDEPNTSAPFEIGEDEDGSTP